MIRTLITRQYSYPIALMLATIAVFYPILSNDFLYGWDDQWMVMNSYTEGGINFKNLWTILTEYYNGQYGPVNEYQYLFLYTLFGYNPFPFHLLSLLLHMGSVYFVYIIVKKTLTLTPRITVESIREIALITALIFAIHPINVESVAWISAIKIINYGFFYLAATYTFLLFIEKKKIKYYIFTILLFTLSFGGKEQAVTLPVWLTMLCWILGCDLKSKRFWLSIIPLFALAIFFGLVTMWSQAAVGAGVLANNYYFEIWQRLILGFYSMFEYLTKFIFPYKLLYIYPFPITLGEAFPAWMLLYPTLFIIIIAALWRYVSKWPLAFGLLFFLVHIGITLHIIQLSRFAIVADRYMYISSIGLAFIIAYYFVLFFNKYKGKVRAIVSALFVALLLYWGVFSNLRCRDWHDVKTIKKDLRELLKQRDDYIPDDDETIDLTQQKGGTTS